MKCFMCRGNLEEKLTNFTVDLGKCVVIVKNVPSQVCTQCGEVSYDNEVALKLEKLVNSVRNFSTEIVVFNYEEQRAA